MWAVWKSFITKSINPKLWIDRTLDKMSCSVYSGSLTSDNNTCSSTDPICISLKWWPFLLNNMSDVERGHIPAWAISNYLYKNKKIQIVVNDVTTEYILKSILTLKEIQEENNKKKVNLVNCKVVKCSKMFLGICVIPKTRWLTWRKTKIPFMYL